MREKGKPHPLTPTPAPVNLHELEGRTVKAALAQVGGNKVQAAKALGVSRRALYRLLAKHGVPVTSP
jgi:DNA-binding NtrC family response regulator